ncbi:hypothetical protein COSO111634_35900 [Corallococcus soli]
MGSSTREWTTWSGVGRPSQWKEERRMVWRWRQATQARRKAGTSSAEVIVHESCRKYVEESGDSRAWKSMPCWVGDNG